MNLHRPLLMLPTLLCLLTAPCPALAAATN
jgi:hypothetical protein